MSKLSKCLWNIEFSAMESCYKLYTWITDAMLMLLLQFLWKMSQISDYFKENYRSEEDDTVPVRTMTLKPLTKDYKFRRHIRSMSDVQSSTPYYRITPFRPRKGSNPTLMYESDSRAKRRQYLKMQGSESSDSSDYESTKIRSIQQNIIKHSDSMRIL